MSVVCSGTVDIGGNPRPRRVVAGAMSGMAPTCRSGRMQLSIMMLADVPHPGHFRRVFMTVAATPDG
jgi:hypothetical protein